MPGPLPPPPKTRGSTQPPQQPSETADEIIPGVWISGWRIATNDEWLRKHQIGAVFNCTKTVEFSPAVPVQHQYRIPVDDNLQPAEIHNMELWAPEIAYKILREFKAGRRVLIHCHAGMQRSATACAFFLMVLTGRPLIQVLYLIQSRRKVAFQPSANFATALRGFEEQVRMQLLPVLEKT
jgi:rhodanese-related sulfurtransferase